MPTMSTGNSLYTWYQDNASVTLDLVVPAGTLPTQLRLLLSRRRVTLLTAEGRQLLRRKTYAQIEPRCTDSYTMPEPRASSPPASAIIRIVLYKAVQAGWISLFQGDLPSLGLIPSPAPMSHTMAHVAALSRAREAAAREARELAARAIHTATSSKLQQNWRSGNHVIRKKTPGGIKIHYERDPAVRALPDAATGTPTAKANGADGADDADEPPTRRGCTRQPWREVRRFVPASDGGGVWNTEGDEAGVSEGGAEAEAPDGGERSYNKRDTDAAMRAIEAARKGQLGGGGDGGGESSSDDETGEGRWEGGGEHPDDIEYPLPGSDATCDSCQRCINKYYHCVQCGVIKGFDLCEDCHRYGPWKDKHVRRYPNHDLKLVSKYTAPVMSKQPQLNAAPPAPPPPKPPPGTRAISERIIVPFEAKVKYEWTQYGGEINLSVAIPQGTRARDLIVVVQPFQMSVSLKG